ncbi:MAG: hypothetical protein H6510_16660 [Acidobacteria bacterium]|nr:hypothetical protein [Acidobacteriota bacterium]MCB9399447.1 hypothetical protein [Acidobacteriota bacterium]
MTTYRFFSLICFSTWVLAVGPTITSVSPNPVSVSTTGGTVSFDLQYQLSGLTYYAPYVNWAWKKTGTNKYWDGTNWVNFFRQYNIDGYTLGGFWGPSTGTNGNAHFTNNSSFFTSNFWAGAESVSVDIQVVYKNQSYFYYSNWITLTFNKETPTLALTSQVKNLQVDLSAAENLSFSMAFSSQYLGTINPANYSWAWSRPVASGGGKGEEGDSYEYWNGSTWVSTAYWSSLTTPSGSFWSSFGLNGDELIGEIAPSLLAGLVTNEDPEITVTLRYLLNGNYVVANPKGVIRASLLPSRAPSTISPEGNVSTATPQLSWTAVPGAQSYRVGIMLPDESWLNPNWQNQVINTTSFNTPTLQPNVDYRVIVYSVNRAGVSTLTSQTTLRYQVDAPAPVLGGSMTIPGGITNLRPTLTWTPANGATGYAVGLQDSHGNWVDPNWQSSVVSAASFTPSQDLDSNETYKVVVVSKNQTVPAAESLVGEVEMNQQITSLTISTNDSFTDRSYQSQPLGNDWINRIKISSNFSLNTNNLSICMKNENGKFWDKSESRWRVSDSDVENWKWMNVQELPVSSGSFIDNTGFNLIYMQSLYPDQNGYRLLGDRPQSVTIQINNGITSSNELLIPVVYSLTNAIAGFSSYIVKISDQSQFYSFDFGLNSNYDCYSDGRFVFWKWYDAETLASYMPDAITQNGPPPPQNWGWYDTFENDYSPIATSCFNDFNTPYTSGWETNFFSSSIRNQNSVNVVLNGAYFDDEFFIRPVIWLKPHLKVLEDGFSGIREMHLHDSQQVMIIDNRGSFYSNVGLSLGTSPLDPSLLGNGNENAKVIMPSSHINLSHAYTNSGYKHPIYLNFVLINPINGFYRKKIYTIHPDGSTDLPSNPTIQQLLGGEAPTESTDVYSLAAYYTNDADGEVLASFNPDAVARISINNQLMQIGELSIDEFEDKGQKIYIRDNSIASISQIFRNNGIITPVTALDNTWAANFDDQIRFTGSNIYKEVVDLFVEQIKDVGGEPVVQLEFEQSFVHDGQNGRPGPGAAITLDHHYRLDKKYHFVVRGFDRFGLAKEKDYTFGSIRTLDGLRMRVFWGVPGYTDPSTYNNFFYDSNYNQKYFGPSQYSPSPLPDFNGNAYSCVQKGIQSQNMELQYIGLFKEINGERVFLDGVTPHIEAGFTKVLLHNSYVEEMQDDHYPSSLGTRLLNFSTVPMCRDSGPVQGENFNSPYPVRAAMKSVKDSYTQKTYYYLTDNGDYLNGYHKEARNIPNSVPITYSSWSGSNITCSAGCINSSSTPLSSIQILETDIDWYYQFHNNKPDLAPLSIPLRFDFDPSVLAQYPYSDWDFELTFYGIDTTQFSRTISLLNFIHSFSQDSTVFQTGKTFYLNFDHPLIESPLGWENFFFGHNVDWQNASNPSIYIRIKHGATNPEVLCATAAQTPFSFVLGDPPSVLPVLSCGGAPIPNAFEIAIDEPGTIDFAQPFGANSVTLDSGNFQVKMVRGSDGKVWNGSAWVSNNAQLWFSCGNGNPAPADFYDYFIADGTARKIYASIPKTLFGDLLNGNNHLDCLIQIRYVIQPPVSPNPGIYTDTSCTAYNLSFTQVIEYPNNALTPKREKSGVVDDTWTSIFTESALQTILAGCYAPQPFVFTPAETPSNTHTRNIAITAGDFNFGGSIPGATLAAPDFYAGPATEPLLSYTFDSGLEGWVTTGDVNPLFASLGQLRGVTSGDSRLLSPTFSFSGSQGTLVEIRLKVSSGTQARLYFETSAGPNPGGFAASNHNYIISTEPDGLWHTYLLDFAQNSAWMNHTIGRFRLDPTDQAGQIEVDSIKVLENPDGPSLPNHNFSVQENWAVVSGVSGFTVSNGKMKGTSTSSSPILSGTNYATSLDGALHHVLELRMRVNGGATGQIRFSTVAQAAWNTQDSVRFQVVPDNQFHTYYIDMAERSTWTQNQIRQIRLFPTDQAGVTFEIDSLRAVPENLNPQPILDSHFDFGSSHGWSNNGNISNWTLQNGVLSGNATSTDPRIIGAVFSPLYDGSQIQTLEIRMKVSAGNTGQLFFVNESVPNFNETDSFRWTVIADNQWHSYIINTSQHPDWNGHQIKRLRFDPTNASGAHFEVDYIRSNSFAEVGTSLARTPDLATFITSLPDEVYASLEIPMNLTGTVSNPSMIGFMVPYPTGWSNGLASAPQKVTLDKSKTSWFSSSNVMYRYNAAASQFTVLIFVDQAKLKAMKILDLPARENPDQETIDGLTSVDPAHNRMYSIAYLDNEGTRQIHTVSFSDLLGRPQETRAKGNTPPQYIGANTLISGVTQIDALGRPIKSIPGLYAPSDLFIAGSRTSSFNAAEVFWHSDKSDANGRVYQKGDTMPYSMVTYEPDARGRTVASSLPGSTFVNDASKHSRFHYFVTKLPDLLPADNIVFYNLPQVTTGATTAPGLVGTLAINPQGGIGVTFTGEGGQTVLEISNPDKAVLQEWGFTLATGAPNYTTWDPMTLYLPNDYDTLIDPNSDGNSKNLVTLHQYDELGRLKATYPPRALHLDGGSPASIDNWNLSKETSAEALSVAYTYDRYNRVIKMTDPDADPGTFYKTKYNLIGQVRFTQSPLQATQSPMLWNEVIYDDRGRTLKTQVVPGSEATIDSLIESTISGLSPITGTITQSWYDALPTSTLPAHFKSAWPAISAAQNPFIDVNHPLVPFGSYFGLASQIQSEHSAERFYYDGKGRILCHVYLHESLVEPKITWAEYDPNDLPTRVYSVYSGQAYGMTYDDWNRVEAIYDLTPVPATMDLQLLYQASDTAGNTSEIGVTQAWLGSLVREDLSLSNTQAIALANYSYGPAGQVIEVVYGDPLKANMKGTYLSDIRGMNLNYELKAGSENLFKQEFDYFGNGGLLGGGEEPLKRYDGMLTRIRETYRPDDSPTNPEEDLLTKTYQYDMGGQLIDAQTTMGFYSGGVTPKTFSNHYGYDRSGNRLYEDRLNVPKSQGADQIGSMAHIIASNSNRLTQVDLSPFNGNLVEMDGKEFPSFTYDANGNILAFEQKFSGTNRDRSFEYGDWRFQTQATHWEQDTEDGTDVHTFTYDHSGARISRSVVKNAGTAEWTHFLPAGNDNMAEFDGFGRMTRNYLFVGGNRIGFKSKRYSGLYVKDHLGSTRMVVDLYSQSSGPNGVNLLTAFSDTDAYGNILRDINVGDFNGQPHGYTGQEREPDYDGMHFGARLYLPDLGRFLQIDPYAEFWNSYSYVGNNPILLVDNNGQYVDGGVLAMGAAGASTGLATAPASAVMTVPGANLVAMSAVSGFLAGSYIYYQTGFGEWALDTLWEISQRKGPEVDLLPPETWAEDYQTPQNQGKPTPNPVPKNPVPAPIPIPIPTPSPNNPPDKSKPDEIQKPKLNLDTGAMIALSSDMEIAHFKTSWLLLNYSPVISTTALAESSNNILTMGTPTEIGRFYASLPLISIVPDVPNPVIMALPYSGRALTNLNDRLIFGTGMSLGIPTLTGDNRFPTAAEHYGVKISYILITPPPRLVTKPKQ